MKKYLDIIIIVLVIVIIGLVIYLLIPRSNEIKEIKLNKEELTLYIGDKGIIRATLTPEDASNSIIWKSMNEDIASVDNNGIVIANSLGETEISVESDDSKVKVTCKVIVIPREIEKIDLSKTSIVLKIGDKDKIEAVITPTNATYGKINYKSSNEKIVKVDQNGNIEALKEGTAEIIVTDEKGSKEARCKITVNKKIVEVKEIKLNKNSLSLSVGKADTLIVTINPSNASSKNVTWTSSDTSVASIDNGTVLAKKEGKTTITAKTVNGLTATCIVTVSKVSTPKPTITPKPTVKPSNGINKIHFIKQSSPADAILIESNNHFAMIDTGYPTASDNKRVYNYLKSKGVKELDFVLLSHVHKDHTGGLEYLANNLKINKIYMKEYIGQDHEPAENKEVYKNIKNVINSKNIPVTFVEKTFSDGQGFIFEDMSIKLYNTPQRMNQKGFVNGNENINSIIALITVKNKKILLPGDSEDDDIMTGIINKIGSVNIVKIPHHGYHNCSFTMASARVLNPEHIVVTNNRETHCREKYFDNRGSDYYVNTISKDALVFTIGNTITVDK